MTNKKTVTANMEIPMRDTVTTRIADIDTVVKKSVSAVKAARVSSDKPPDLVKKIGNTLYEMSFHFSDTGKDTFTDKIMRLIRRDLQNQ